MAGLAQLLLAFYDREGRSLPWRGERDLYRIWVAEIMLQQTGVTTVLPYYPRFLERFPDIQSLSSANEEEVLTVWQGLGYYQRARHLHRAAQRVVATMGGKLPEQLADLLGLPGIGPSTAAAILAIGRDQPHAILDGNVKRVLARLIALPQPLSSKSAQQQLWTLAQQLTPNHRPGDYAQAIMDLGATICTYTHPNCHHCPWQAYCQAHAQGKSTAFPLVNPRPAKPHRIQGSALIFDDHQRLLLCQRPSSGLLAGLWEPPAVPITTDEPLPPTVTNLTRTLLHHCGLKTVQITLLPDVQHIFTHFRLTVYPFAGQLESGQFRLNDYQKYRWIAREAVSELPLATLHRKILAKLGDKELLR